MRWHALLRSGESYCSVMKQKGLEVDVASKHFGRMQGFKAKFMATNPGSGMFGAIHVGKLDDCYWWDYGMLRLYMKNNLLATMDTPEALALHKFMRITNRVLYTEVSHL